MNKSYICLWIEKCIFASAKFSKAKKNIMAEANRVVARTQENICWTDMTIFKLNNWIQKWGQFQNNSLPASPLRSKRKILISFLGQKTIDLFCLYWSFVGALIEKVLNGCCNMHSKNKQPTTTQKSGSTRSCSCKLKLRWIQIWVAGGKRRDIAGD